MKTSQVQVAGAVDQLEVTGKGIILGEIIEAKTDNEEEILN